VNAAGTPFYLMQHLDGRIFKDVKLPSLSPNERAAVYDEGALPSLSALSLPHVASSAPELQTRFAQLGNEAHFAMAASMFTAVYSPALSALLGG
jgi:hypothetical protein